MSLTKQPADARKVHPGLIVILLIIVFLGPFGFAVNMHKKAEKMALKHNNVGELIMPIKHAQDLVFTELDTQRIFTGDTLAGKWQFIYIPPLICDKNCHETIDMMGQIHQSLNKSVPRLERMIVLLDKNQAAELAQYNRKYYLDSKSYNKTLSTIGDKTKSAQVGEFYIVDPNSNIMMYYAGDTAPKGILKDLNKLMKVSQIG